METMKKRALSLILALVLALSLLPISVLATEGKYEIGQSYDFGTDVESALPRVSGAHWENPTVKQGELVCTLAHEHSTACVTGAKEIKKDAYDANNPKMFALDTYYKLTCTTSADKHEGNDPECFKGTGGDGIAFMDTGVAGWIRKIDGQICVYKFWTHKQDAGWYAINCTEDHTEKFHTDCTGERVDIYDGQPHMFERGKQITGADGETLYIGELTGKAEQCMMKKSGLIDYWYNLSCTKEDHFHHHSMENGCYEQVDTAEQRGEDGITETTYYQCTIPTHKHIGGCYKTLYAWTLVKDAPADVSVTIVDAILETGCFSTTISGFEKPTYSWAKSTGKNGDYTTIEGANEGSINVVKDRGARMWYQITVTEGDKTATARAFVKYYDSIQNGSFEAVTVGWPNQPCRQVKNDTDGLIWRNNTDKDVELIDGQNAHAQSTFTVKGAADEKQFAEVNAHCKGQLYQDVLTVPGETLQWGLSYKGRDGKETTTVQIAGLVGSKNKPVEQNLTAKGNAAWEFYGEGKYEVPENQYVTRFSLIGGGNGSKGSLVDCVSFGTATPKTPVPADPAKPADPNAYTINFLDQEGNAIIPAQKGSLTEVDKGLFCPSEESLVAYAKAGYVFDWELTNTKTGSRWKDVDSINSAWGNFYSEPTELAPDSHVLDLYFTRIPATEVTVTYVWAQSAEKDIEALGAKLPESQTIDMKDGSATVAPLPASKAPYTVTGWYLDKDCKTLCTDKSQLISAEMTLYAKVSRVEKLRQYGVRYAYTYQEDSSPAVTQYGDPVWTTGVEPTKEAVWTAAPETVKYRISSGKPVIDFHKAALETVTTNEKGFDSNERVYTVSYTAHVYKRGNLMLYKEIETLTGEAKDALTKKLIFRLVGPVNDHIDGYAAERPYDADGMSFNGLRPGMYTITETGAEVDGYTLSTKYSWEDADPVTDGYQVEVVAQVEPTVATITNTYVGKQYRLIFEAGDYGVMRDGGTENDPDPDPDSTFTWEPNDDGTYAWQREQTGKPASQKTWTYRFTKSQVTKNPAMRSGNQASAPNPAINASSGNTFQGYYLLNSDGIMSDTAYDTGNTEGILGGGLYAAYTAMEAAGTDSLTYRAKYNVSTPIDPTPTPTPDPDPNPGSGGDYEPQNPATPPVTTLPDGETPLADLPDGETPLANLPDEETPLADLPDEETPLADAPKTGDSVGIWAALLGVSGMAIAGLTLGKRKKTEAN